MLKNIQTLYILVIWHWFNSFFCPPFTIKSWALGFDPFLPLSTKFILSFFNYWASYLWKIGKTQQKVILPFCWPVIYSTTAYLNNILKQTCKRKGFWDPRPKDLFSSNTCFLFVNIHCMQNIIKSEEMYEVNLGW